MANQISSFSTQTVCNQSTSSQIAPFAFLPTEKLIALFVENKIFSPYVGAFPSKLNIQLKNEEKLKEEWNDILVETWNNQTGKVAESHQEKNRYTDNHPYDENRYKFQNLSIKDNYINASCFPSGHILAQGPLQGTVDDFWLMALESKSPVIVMVTGCMENGTEKCFPYWLVSPQTVKLVSLGESSLGSNPKVAKRPYSLSYGEASHDVCQFHVQDWADHNPYDAKKLFSLIKEIEAYRVEKNISSKPIIVHCSAGLGRSGVFTACHILYQIWQTTQEPLLLNLSAFIKFLRSPPHGRNGLLTNITQYQAVYEFASLLSSTNQNV